MICKGCGGETSNEEGMCNICMLFGSPKEYKEQGIDIVIERKDMLIGKKDIDSEQEEIDGQQKIDEYADDIPEDEIEIEKEEEDTPVKHVLEHLEEQRVGVPKWLLFNSTELNYLDENTIQSFRQNIPELIVSDCIKEFNLDDEQAERLRIILIARGVNKWFYVRREFIRLKHQIKDMLKSKDGVYGDIRVHRIIEGIYIRMQNMAKMPRFVEWPRTLTHKWSRIERDIKIKGKRV